MRRKLFKKGDIVRINGDIDFDDYSIRVSTMATVIDDEPAAGDTQLLCCLDEIDGDHNVSVFVDIDDLLRCNPKYEEKSDD